VVLETQPPEENIVAVAKFIFDKERQAAIVDLICAIGADAGEIKTSFTIMLRKLENVVYSHNLNSIIIEAASWRTDVQELLVDAGYIDNGGHSYPSNQEHFLLKPTMILEYSKELRREKLIVSSSAKNDISTAQSKSNSSSSTFDALPLDLMSNTLKEQTHIIGASHNHMLDDLTWEVPDTNLPLFPNSEVGNIECGDNMEILMSKLFTALHSENKSSALET
jgi:hypothetical protein